MANISVRAEIRHVIATKFPGQAEMSAWAEIHGVSHALCRNAEWHVDDYACMKPVCK